MGWGGSAQAMINTLKANDNLLRKRKLLFERDKSFGAIKKRYTKASAGILKGPSPSQSELAKIRDKIVRQRRKEIIVALSSTLIIILIVWIGVSILYNSYASQNQKESRQRQLDYNEKMAQAYHHNMQEGLKKMQTENYFFAVGNFSEALHNIPGDSTAEYQLAYAFCMLCATEQKACLEANRLVNKLSRKHPKSAEYDILRANYLRNK